MREESYNPRRSKRHYKPDTNFYLFYTSKDVDWLKSVGISAYFLAY